MKRDESANDRLMPRFSQKDASIDILRERLRKTVSSAIYAKEELVVPEA